ncbi:MAG TPA: hypothetical protein VNM90_12265, partial [Haliangium sp.]|nr:hypothetical protein [Haliangium sp.]
PGSERRQLERAERLIEALAPAVLALAQARAHATRATDALLVPAPPPSSSAAPYQCAPAALTALAALDLAVTGSSAEPAPAEREATEHEVAQPAPAGRPERALLQAALDHGQRWARGEALSATGAPPAIASPSATGSPGLPGLDLVFATPCTRAVAALAAAQLARVEHGRALLSRHVTGKTQGEHLAALLSHAERAALEHARSALAATGAIPAASRLAFQSAHEHARTSDPTGALARFWTASLHAELAVTLARHAR